ncbi:hypothetical protein BO78DRAFT_427530 [Aspergillus sclerotiicarbonarius CBS 121057]|uniref:Uncharacterized protein n=1 Tax=Aspergillus sclerotiicarbonarius (strain CBS 121057 / IBT 28362) TaxID=1448318 RepID=A0A319FL87_ASPSB|nr:hypothetical protein BO78DRAFT_427530 [Aspergillus sclerotiicarbonarius CBS 121057]
MGYEIAHAFVLNGAKIYMANCKEEQGRVHPGAGARLMVLEVSTAMQQEWKDAYPGLLGKLLTTVRLAAGRTVEHGSFSALYAATGPEIEEKGWNRYYFNDPARPGKESAQASDPTLGAALLELSHRIFKTKVAEDAIVDWIASA